MADEQVVYAIPRVCRVAFALLRQTVNGEHVNNSIGKTIEQVQGAVEAVVCCEADLAFALHLALPCSLNLVVDKFTVIHNKFSKFLDTRGEEVALELVLHVEAVDEVGYEIVRVGECSFGKRFEVPDNVDQASVLLPDLLVVLGFRLFLDVDKLLLEFHCVTHLVEQEG